MSLIPPDCQFGIAAWSVDSQLQCIKGIPLIPTLSVLRTSNKLIRFQPIYGEEAAAHITRPGLFCQTPPRSSGRQLESQIPTLGQPLSGTGRTITPFPPHWLAHCGLRDWIWVARPHSLLICTQNSQNPSFSPLQPPQVLLRCKKVSNRIILPTIPSIKTHPPEK
jgi:hypothetical protein